MAVRRLRERKHTNRFGQCALQTLALTVMISPARPQRSGPRLDSPRRLANGTLEGPALGGRVLCGEGEAVPRHKGLLKPVLSFLEKRISSVNMGHLGHMSFELASLFPTHLAYFVALPSEIW